VILAVAAAEHGGGQFRVQHRYDEAFQALDESLARFRQLPTRREDMLFQFVRTLLATGRVMLDLGRAAECVAIADEAVAVCRRLIGLPLAANLSPISQALERDERQHRLDTAVELRNAALAALDGAE
jgi:hypothetical protein